MTAPHSVHHIINDMEKNPHGWPEAYEVRDALGRRPVSDFGTYFGFRPDIEGSGTANEHRAKMSAERARVKADWFAGLPVGLRKSGLLDSARTVYGRALNALGYIDRDECGQPRADKYTPEERDIITDLEAVVARLDNWKRTGRTPKYPGK